MATRTFNIYSYNLKQDVTLMLTFSPPESPRLFIDQFPVVWKVIKLLAGCHSKTSVTYVARHAFSIGQSEQGNLVGAQTWQEIHNGEATTVVGSGDSLKFLPVEKSSNPDLVVLKNKTGGQIDVTFGFVKGDGIGQRYEPNLLWKGLGNETSLEVELPRVEARRGEIEVTLEKTLRFLSPIGRDVWETLWRVASRQYLEVKFTPRLSVYVTRDYQATEIVRGEIEELIWTQDLDALPELSGWNFSEDADGNYSLEQASTA